MKPKTLLIITFSFIFLSTTFGQKNKELEGQKHYSDFSYHESIKKLSKVPDKSADINRQLADSYFKIGDYQNAEKYYWTLVQSLLHTPDDLYQYASVLKINQKYTEAENWMLKFNKEANNDSRGKLHAENTGYFKYLLKDNEQFAISSLEMNTAHEDFGVTYFGDKVVYVTSKVKRSFIRRDWNWNELPFLDLYIAEINPDYQLINSKPLHKNLNKKYHEGPSTFSKDGKFMIFTSDNYKELGNDRQMKLQLYTSKSESEVWQKPESLPFNSKDYSCGHPTLSDNQKTLYFVSDMPGGFGGSDIYKVDMKSDGNWGEPVNMGANINTEGDEMFPFIHKDGLLFFASNGLLGLGGLDIFVLNMKNPTSTPLNVGVPVNSSYDDFSIILNSSQKNGFFASNRPSGEGDDDLYKFSVLKPITFGKKIEGIAKNNAGNVLADVNVNLYDNKGNSIKTVKTDIDGMFSFAVETNQIYKLEGTKTDYLKAKTKADATVNKLVIKADLVLAPKPDFSIYCLVSNQNTGEPIEGAEIIVKDKIKNTQETIVTTESGDFFRALKNARVNDKISYEISFKCPGYLGKTISYDNTLTVAKQYNIHEEMNMTMHKIAVGDDIGKMLGILPIYFDVNKSNIRPDAALELDKLVETMNENPNLEIELGSHTDSRGSDSYNIKLSDRRAKSSAEYVKKRITNPGRIHGKGYGESQLINKCDNGVKCSDKEHQLNRRTEFKITKV